MIVEYIPKNEVLDVLKYWKYLEAYEAIKNMKGVIFDEPVLNENYNDDIVNHPSHYETGKFECIDVMLETQGIEAVQKFCICNAFKYIYRHLKKNGIEDIRKADWYLKKCIELEESKMEGDYKEVYFNDYCPLCVNKDLPEVEDIYDGDKLIDKRATPCFECQGAPVRVDSHIPEKFEAKE